jgi:hypothetical protein
MQPIVTRLLRERDGIGRVLRGIRILAPAITDNQEDGFAHGGHGEKLP